MKIVSSCMWLMLKSFLFEEGQYCSMEVFNEEIIYIRIGYRRSS